MKKRIQLLAGLLTACALAVAGCSGGNAQEDFQKLLEANQQVTDLDADTTTKTAMTYGEQSQNMTMDMNIKVSGENTDAMKMAMTGTMDAGYGAMDIATYYTDGYMYSSVSGMNYKTPMDLTDAMKQLGSNTSLADLAMDAYQEVQKKTEGGSTVYSYTCDPAKMTDYVNQTVQSMSGSMGVDPSDITMTINSMSGTITVNKDSQMTAQTTALAYDIEVQGEKMTMNMTLDMTVNNPGQPVTVELPDLTGYQEISTDGSDTASGDNGTAQNATEGENATAPGNETQQE